MPSPTSPRVTTFALGPLETNCHLLDTGDKAVAVDPGGDPAEVIEFLTAQGLTLERILVTHLHFDHIYGAAALSEATGATVLIPPGDEHLLQNELGRGGFMGFPMVDDFAFEHLSPGTYEFIGLECHVLATPGHTPGSLSYYFPAAKCAFVGDLIFYRSIGRTDFPGGSLDALLDSVRTRIFTLPPETTLHAGHMIETTVHDEMLHNPYFRE